MSAVLNLFVGIVLAFLPMCECKKTATTPCSNGVCRWKLWVRTCKVVHAGTDELVQIKLYHESGAESPRWKNIDTSRNDFERYSAGTYYFDFGEDKSKVIRYKLGIPSSGADQWNPCRTILTDIEYGHPALECRGFGNPSPWVGRGVAVCCDISKNGDEFGTGSKCNA